MEQFKQFNIEKQAAIDTLEKLHEILKEIGEMGINVEGDLEKIASATRTIESDVLRIALLGAFSDGKTSVVAAWLGKVMGDMKIDMDESSDRLAIYKPEGLPGQCEIIDTPGLFGDKEKTVDGEQMMYQDVTKRYISEAHLIFYVVDATNPLKDSHKDIVKWILRDLNKLSSTIFIINKMDEVTDLTEQALFDEQAVIKKENLKLKLQRAAGLTPTELDQLNIVCLASNPNGRGLDFWFSKPEQYESRSRINDLKAMTSHVLKVNVPQVLMAKTGLDVVRDVAGKKIALAHAQLNELDSYAHQNLEESIRIKEDIHQGQKEVKRLAGELFNELQTMERQIFGHLRPLSQEDIREFMEDEIGYSDSGVGYKLNLKIKSTIDGYFLQSSAITDRISLDIGRQLDSSESFIETMSKSALKSASGALKGLSVANPAAIKGAIFTARDVLGNVTGVAIKFKPWGATKLAASITKWAGPAGAVISLGMDGYEAYKADSLEKELIKVKNDISDLIKSAFKDIYDILGNDERIFDFFAPQLKEYENIIREMSQGADLIRANQKKVEHVQMQLKNLPLLGISVSN